MKVMKTTSANLLMGSVGGTNLLRSAMTIRFNLTNRTPKSPPAQPMSTKMGVSHMYHLGNARARACVEGLMSEHATPHALGHQTRAAWWHCPSSANILKVLRAFAHALRARPPLRPPSRPRQKLQRATPSSRRTAQAGAGRGRTRRAAARAARARARSPIVLAQFCLLVRVQSEVPVHAQLLPDERRGFYE